VAAHPAADLSEVHTQDVVTRVDSRLLNDGLRLEMRTAVYLDASDAEERRGEEQLVPSHKEQAQRPDEEAKEKDLGQTAEVAADAAATGAACRLVSESSHRRGFRGSSVPNPIEPHVVSHKTLCHPVSFPFGGQRPPYID
jgi:hypothetical protein